MTTRFLDHLKAGIGRPAYDRRAVAMGIVHLGVGAFHRAHQAAYCDDVLAAGDLRWGIEGVSLRSPSMRDALAKQDWLYTLCIRSGHGDRARVIGSLGNMLVAPENPQDVLAALCRPETKIISLTITEKGYCHDPASGDLADAHPDILHDLDNPHAPKTAPGFLVEAIRVRREKGLAQPTILSCDNLPSNGRTAKSILTQFATLRDPGLGRFVEDEIRCPSTMVDRIVPATTDADRDKVAATLGVRDAWPVMTEPFSQWVIEDDFAQGRPDWDTHGAQFVRDVEPYELMKLRLLNGSHSAIAYLGYLAGFETVSDAIANPDMATFVRTMMDVEATPTLPPLSEIDLDAYKTALLDRFANPALKHRTWQIAMDGSQKLPQRLLAPIREHLAKGRQFNRAALAVAGWMRYAAGLDEKGRVIDVRDPLQEVFTRIRHKAGADPDRLVAEFLQIREVFGDDLPDNDRFVESVRRALAALLTHGAAECLARAVSGPDTSL